MFIFPYRVKNPCTRFPIVTIALIVINVVVYIFTAESNLLIIRLSIVKSYSAGGEQLPFLNYFTGMFLHADLFHIVGNMLYLWVFGPAVEDRLGMGKFTAVYFSAGLAGNLLQSLVTLTTAGIIPTSIGASGCIMGICGAYMYLYPWSVVCVAYWFLIVFYGVIKVAAVWVIGFFLAMDLFNGIRSAGAVGGVGHFCHVGGAAAAILLCMVMKIKRDTAEISEAKETQAEVKDLANMPVQSLQTILEGDPVNPTLIRALVKRAMELHYPEAIEQAMTRAGHQLVDKDPTLVAYYLTSFKGNVFLYHPAVLMRLAGLLERANQAQLAVNVYRILCDSYPSAPDVETALFRMAQCYWNFFRDYKNALNCIEELGRKYPNSPITPYARNLKAQISNVKP